MTDEQLQTNGFDPEAVVAFIGRIENIQAEIDGIIERAREECSPLRDDIASVKREAADAGIPKTELAAVLRKRRYEAKAEHAGDKLDLEQRANFEAMIESLERLAEQLPGLGEAARDRAKAAA